MTVPPCIMKLYITDSRHNLRLWLPLFLLWLLAAMIALVLLPLLLIAAATALCSRRIRQVLAGVAVVYKCMCSLRGLKLDLKQKNEKIEIAVL